MNIRGLIEQAHEYGRALALDILRGVRDGSGVIGLWFAYVLSVLVLLSPLVIATVIVIEATK